MKFHPYAEVFPLLEGAEFDVLVEDIKSFGLREKIWLYEGKVLDGRNRLLACQKAKVKPECRTFKGTAQGAIALVVSANMHRRHLNESQRAMAAARITFFLKNDPNLSENKGPEEGGVPIGTASTSLNVSPRSVKRARKVLEKGSKSLQEAVDAGEVSVAKASKVADLPKSKQLAAATKKSEQKDKDEPERVEPEDNEGERIELMEREYQASIDKVMSADNKLEAAHKEIKRQAAEIASLKLSRDGFMNGKTEMTKLLKKEQAKNDRLVKENESLTRELTKRRAA